MYKKLMLIACITAFMLLLSSGQGILAKETNFNKEQDNTIYLSDGSFYNEPSADFNPINATDEELKLYGLPQRPSDPSDLEQWKKNVSSKWVKPVIRTGKHKFGALPKSIDSKNKSIADDVTFTTSKNSYNYCGYERIATSYGSKATITVPSVSSTSSYRPAYEAQWVGLGGLSSGYALAQVGTCGYVTSSGSADYYAWYETLNTNVGEDSHEITSVPVSPGDQVFISVWLDTIYNSSDYNISYYISNTTKSLSTTVTVRVNTYSGLTSSAEWILERPCVNGSLAYMARPTVSNLYQVPFSGCGYKTNTTSVTWTTAADATNVAKCDMMCSDGSHYIATPGSLISGAFTSTWFAYN